MAKLITIHLWEHEDMDGGDLRYLIVTEYHQHIGSILADSTFHEGYETFGEAIRTLTVELEGLVASED